MNERIKELAKQSLPEFYLTNCPSALEKFAELIVGECINTLEFHGFDDAVPYIKWMATNKLGVKE
jgi:hypothetical protein